MPPGFTVGLASQRYNFSHFLPFLTVLTDLGGQERDPEDLWEQTFLVFLHHFCSLLSPFWSNPALNQEGGSPGW